ncbi:hypothetical protein [Marinobacterium aestuariivivens]
MLLVGFAIHDVDRLSETGRLTLPVMPERSRWEILTMVAGTLIVVQGFETPRPGPPLLYSDPYPGLS